MSKWTVRSSYEDWNSQRTVLLAGEDESGRIVSYVSSLTVIVPKDDGLIIPPTITLRATDFLQAALEEAWRIGLRPKNWRLETTEQVAAINNHLEDMRALVFAKPPASKIRPPSK